MKLLMYLTPMLAILLQSGLSNAMPFDSTATSSSEGKGVLTVTRGPQTTNFNVISSIQPVVMPSSEPDGASIVTALSISSVSAPTQASTTSEWLSHASASNLGSKTVSTGGSVFTQGPQSSDAGRGFSVPGAHFLRDLWGSKPSTVDSALPAAGEAYAPVVKVARSNEPEDSQSSPTSTCHTTSTHTPVPPANAKRDGGYQPYGDPFDPPPNSAAHARLRICPLLLAVAVLWTTLLIFSLPQPAMAATIPPAPSAPPASTDALSEKSNGGGSPFDPPPGSGAPQSLKLCSSLSVAIIVLWMAHFILSLPQVAAAESTSTLEVAQHKGGSGGAGAHSGGGGGAVVGGAHSGGGHEGGSSCASEQIKVQSLLLLLVEALLAAFWVRYLFRQRPMITARSGNEAQT